MKKQSTTILKRAILLLASLLVLIGCSEDETAMMTDNEPPTEEAVDNDEENGEEAENENEEGQTAGIDPNLLTQSFKFRNMQVKQGSIPINPNSPYFQTPGFQISQDTIFWVEGVTNRIQIRKPDGFGPLVGSFMAQVPGADSYIEAELEREKENDTLVFLNFDFDPPIDWELPISFDLDITLIDDETGEPIGKFPKPVEIEEPTSSSGNCGALYDELLVWQWIETSVNGQYQSGPDDTFNQELKVGGCCDFSQNPPVSFTGGCNENNPGWTELEYTNSYHISFDIIFLRFDTDYLFGGMYEVAYNLDAPNVDFCSSTAPLRDDTKYNNFEGELYDFNPASCSFKIRNLKGQNELVVLDTGEVVEFPLPIYIGSGDGVEYQLISPHFIKETRTGEAPLERIYIGTHNNESTGLSTFWYEITYKQDSSS